MEKAVKIIGMMKWLGLPLGYIMLFATRESFGDIAGTFAFREEKQPPAYLSFA